MDCPVSSVAASMLTSTLDLRGSSAMVNGPVPTVLGRWSGWWPCRSHRLLRLPTNRLEKSLPAMPSCSRLPHTGALPPRANSMTLIR